MTPRQAEQYRTMATEAEWALEDAAEAGRLTATNILAMYTRLKQFADAYCDVQRTGKETSMGVPELKVQQTEDSGKLEQLMQKLEEENVFSDDEPKRALVYSQFNPMSRMVADAIEKKGVKVEMILAGKTKHNKEVEDAFQAMEPDSPRVIVMNTMMGTALNLSAADSVHMLDETWVPDNQEQAEDRAHRGDEITMAKDLIRVYYYRSRGTVEEYIRQLVADKALNNRTILDLRRKMAKIAADEANKED
jgi:SNF2 family DNA or RNA helicase